MFFREDPVNILRYLPQFLSKDMNFKSVAEANNMEHEKIRLMIQDVFNQFFVESATWGLSSYERVLDIAPNQNDDYTARRNRILLRYQSNNTSTVAFLESLLKRYVDSDTTIRIIEDNGHYSFTVVSSGGTKIDINGIFEALDVYKPAHLAAKVQIKKEVTAAGNNSFYLGFLSGHGGKQIIGLPLPTKAEMYNNFAMIRRIGGHEKVNISMPNRTPVNLFAGVALCVGGKITVGRRSLLDESV